MATFAHNYVDLLLPHCGGRLEFFNRDFLVELVGSNIAVVEANGSIRNIFESAAQTMVDEYDPYPYPRSKELLTYTIKDEFSRLLATFFAKNVSPDLVRMIQCFKFEIADNVAELLSKHYWPQYEEEALKIAERYMQTL
jgi:hypothetical protein